MNFEKEKLDILIQGGQSNAEGYGLGPVECEYVPCGEILYLVDDRAVEVLTRGVAFTGQKHFRVTEAGDHVGYEGISERVFFVFLSDKGAAAFAAAPLFLPAADKIIPSDHSEGIHYCVKRLALHSGRCC